MKLPSNVKQYLILAVSSWVGYELRDIPHRVMDFVNSKFKNNIEIYDHNDMYVAFMEWYYHFYPQDFRRIEASIHKKHNNGVASYKLIKESLSHTRGVKYKGHRIFINKNRIDVLKDGLTSSNYKKVNVYNISCYTSKTILNEMVEEVYNWWVKKQNTSLGLKVVVTDTWYDQKNIYVPVYKRLDNIYVEGKDELIKDIERFLSKRELYYEYGVKFKRTYALYGPPGVGKTTLVFGVADMLDRPVYYLNPSGFGSDNTFEEFIGSVPDKSIVLIEDIDVFWTDRKSDGKTNVSFQSLLNVLDGIHSPNDMIIFVTTNHFDKLDEALTRKGRLDYKMYIGYTTRKLANKFISEYYKVNTYDVGADFPDDVPMVDMQHICLRNETIEEFNNEFNKYKSEKNGEKF